MEFKKDDNKYKKISIEYSKELSKDEKVIKKRDDIWDNFKGILSFTVVFAHYLYHYLSVKGGTMVSVVFIFSICQLLFFVLVILVNQKIQKAEKVFLN